MTPIGKKCDPLAPRPLGGRYRKLNYRQMCAYGLHELTSHDSSATMAYLFGIHPGTTTRCSHDAQILLNDVFHLFDKAWAIVPSMLAQDMLSHLVRDHTGGESRLSDSVFATTKNIWAIDGYPVPTKRSGNRFIQSAHFQTKAGYHCTLGIELFSVTGCTDAYVTNIPGRYSELAESAPIFDILRDKTVTIPHAKAYADSLFRVKELQEYTSAVPKAVEKISSWDKGNLAVTKEKARNTMEHRFWAGKSLAFPVYASPYTFFLCAEDTLDNIAPLFLRHLNAEHGVRLTKSVSKRLKLKTSSNPVHRGHVLENSILFKNALTRCGLPNEITTTFFTPFLFKQFPERFTEAMTWPLEVVAIEWAKKEPGRSPYFDYDLLLPITVGATTAVSIADKCRRRRNVTFCEKTDGGTPSRPLPPPMSKPLLPKPPPILKAPPRPAFSDEAASFSELINSTSFDQLERVKEVCWRIGGLSSERVLELIASVNNWEGEHLAWAAANPGVDPINKRAIGCAALPCLPPYQRSQLKLRDFNLYTLGGLMDDDTVSQYFLILARSARSVAAAYDGDPPLLFLDAAMPATILRMHRGMNEVIHSVMARFQARPFLARSMEEGTVLVAPVCDNAHYNVVLMSHTPGFKVDASMTKAPVQCAAEEVNKLRGVGEILEARRQLACVQAGEEALAGAVSAGETNEKKLERIAETASSQMYKELERKPEFNLARQRHLAAAASCAAADAPPAAPAAVSPHTSITVIDSMSSYGLDVKALTGLTGMLLTERKAFGLGAVDGSVRGEVAARSPGQGDFTACGVFSCIAILFFVFFGRLPVDTDYGYKQNSAGMTTIEVREARRRARTDAVALRLIILDSLLTGYIRWPGVQRGARAGAPPTPAGTFVARDDTADVVAKLKYA